MTISSSMLLTTSKRTGPTQEAACGSRHAAPQGRITEHHAEVRPVAGMDARNSYYRAISLEDRPIVALHHALSGAASTDFLVSSQT